jgi:hypothetical protein
VLQWVLLVTYPPYTRGDCVPKKVDDIVLAHRATRQINVAGAGGVAHLPRMVTAMTPIDSLYLIVQMPEMEETVEEVSAKWIHLVMHF